ncbi:MAG: hypothetical protein AB1757_10180 [Acidobacteriota bacterium]
MKSCFALLVFVLLTGTAFGQDRPEQISNEFQPHTQTEQIKNEIYRLANSSSISERAWAAYLIGKHNLKEIAPLLLELLADRENRNHYEEFAFSNVALDALVQLNATVPAEALVPIYTHYPHQVLILLALSPAENQKVLLDIAKTQAVPDIFWLMTHNLLSESKAKGFAALILRDLHLETSVSVQDDESPGYGFGGSIGSGNHHNFKKIPEGFPPTAIYALTGNAERGATVIAPGKRPVFYLRQILEPGTTSRVSVDRAFYLQDKDEAALEYLAALLDTTQDDLNLVARDFQKLIWKGKEKYKTDIEAIRKNVETDFSNLKYRLMEKGLLTEDEFEAGKLNLAIKIYDRRAVKKIPLPDLSGITKAEEN